MTFKIYPLHARHFDGPSAPTVLPRRSHEALQGPLSVVDDNQKVVGALSVVGATKMPKFMKFLFLLKSLYDKWYSSPPKRAKYLFLRSSCIFFVSTWARRFSRYFWRRSDFCAFLLPSYFFEQIVFISSGFNHQGRDLFVHSLFNFFSRNDVFNQRFRGAEGESYPQSPPAGALLLKKN